MKELIIEHWEKLAVLVSGAFGFFGGRKIKKSNEKSAELENLKTIREMEKQLVDDTKKQVEELREMIGSLQEIINQKDIIISEQEEIIKTQRKQLDKCKTQCKIK